MKKSVIPNNPEVNEQLSSKDYMKFLIPSLIGVFLFLFPLIRDGAVNIPLGYLIDFFKNASKPFGKQVIYGVVILSSSITLIHRLVKFKFIKSSKFWSTIFEVGVKGKMYWKGFNSSQCNGKK
ncbi:hypothetical protein [Wukongibacter sp. M2B1]|uniref:hypothetical protein n=1 Tax=Wukongibacter sp. M2B1 TaxID=3088895 RepID=UPI003D7A78AE